MSCDGPELSAAAQAVVALLTAQRVVDAALEAGLRERLGIGGTHFDVLRALSTAPGEQLRMVDIAERMCISRSGVTQTVDRLEQLGLVRRVTSRDDRRLVLATITPAGRALVPLGGEVLEAVAERFVTGRLSGDQAQALGGALASMTAASGAVGGVAGAGAACPPAPTHPAAAGHR